ncbi:MAG: ribonuclease P protein component [Kiritimatiellia bacterium]
MPARLRVKRAALFQEAYAQGQKTVGRYAVLWLRQGEDAAGRLGVVASKKVGNSVQRSRAKRRLREWYRINRHRLCGPEDFILVARRSILEVPQPALDADLQLLFSRAGQLQSPEE